MIKNEIIKEREALLRASRLSVQYDDKTALKNVNFELCTGEILGIVGESGSGKSTILKAITGMLTGSDSDAVIDPSSEIRFRGKELLSLRKKELRELLGREIGMIFQNPASSLCPVRTVRSQIEETVREHASLSKREVDEMAKEFFHTLGFPDPDRILDSYPFQLSGGMSQRVCICMAVLLRPALLLADEPTSALDVTIQKQVAEELLQIRARQGMSMILVTHNIGLVEKMADKVLVLKNGNVMEYGTTQQVLKEPQSEYTRQLLQSVPRLRKGEGV